MVRKLKVIALFGALMMATTPSFAQDPLSDLTKGLGQLDPTGTLSPAAPAAAPAAKKAKRKHFAKKKVAKKKMIARKAVAKKKFVSKKPIAKKKIVSKKPVAKKMMKKKVAKKK